jgi:hypothetical protein
MFKNLTIRTIVAFLMLLIGAAFISIVISLIQEYFHP